MNMQDLHCAEEQWKRKGLIAATRLADPLRLKDLQCSIDPTWRCLAAKMSVSCLGADVMGFPQRIIDERQRRHG